MGCAEEEGEGETLIKPGQEAKCTKCLKAPYLARHASFCAKCSDQQGAAKGELKGDCTRCKAGSKYAKKHLAFCTDSCGGLKKKKKKATQMKKKAMMAPKKKSTTTMKKATPVSGLSMAQSATKVSATEPLGPLAQIFKSLVVANTW